MEQLDWADLRAFLAFLRTGSVRPAAHVLGVSHSTIARRLDQLETQIGVPLYRRTSDGVSLTAAGQEVHDAALRIEAELSGLDRRLFARETRLEGPLILTLMDELMVDPFVSLLHAFKTAHPGIDLKLDTGMARSNLDRREADLALRFGRDQADHLTGRRLGQTARAVYAQRTLIDNRTSPHSLGWISFSGFSGKETWKRSTPFPDQDTVLRCFDIRSQHVACRAGFGLALLPCFLCDLDPELVRVSDPEFVSRQDLWLLRHPDTKNNPRIRALMDHIIDNLPRLTPLLRGETARTVQIADHA
ncbi:LysR family transcriptional regulator [Maricaulis sp. D1M11]|uniref:LysR family transcriptional regulator n=1 Tax=Maricaulis sp. D1M11 TaxID=3076117 RepID=UPI0039B46553